MKILFVCAGNVGRSQFAEAFYNRMCNGKGIAESAGTRAYNVGRKLGDYAFHVVNCMKEMGYDISEHTSRQLAPEMLEQADRVIVMAERETWPDFLEKSNKIEVWKVENPAAESYEMHMAARDKVHGLVAALLKE